MPRSRILLVLGPLLFAAAAARLGVWQLDRLAARRAANAAALARQQLPEIVLGDVNRGQDVNSRRARAYGSYDRAHEIVLRGQALEGVPGVVVVTPLRPEAGGDSAVLVERGFAPSPDALSLPADPPLDEPGPREVRGLAFAIPPGGGQPLEQSGRLTLRRLDLSAIRARVPYPVLDVYLRQLPDTGLPGFPRRRPAPALDEGPHRLYAIQWFAFAAMAVVFALVFARKTADRPTV